MNRKIIFVVFMLVFSLNLSMVNASSRVALVIGNGAYKSAPLKNPVNDATDMAAILEDSGFDVMLILNASQREIKTSVRSFGKKLRKNDCAGLFYYAGHGIQLKGHNYLIPVGCTIESEGDVEFEAVDAGLILNKMEDAGNDLNIVILDACRNNPFARNFRSSGKGLARMDAPKGTIVAYATAPGELAADGKGRNGPYTKHLIRNIQKTHLTIEQVFKNVRVAVVSETSNKQIPWESSSLMGTFYFNPQQTGQTNIKQTVLKKQPENSYEILFWESIKDSTEVESFKAYLNQFPNGVFTSLAKLRIHRYSDKSIKNRTASKGGEPASDFKTNSPFTYDSKKRTILWHDFSKAIKLKDIKIDISSPITVKVDIPDNILNNRKELSLVIQSHNMGHASSYLMISNNSKYKSYSNFGGLNDYSEDSVKIPVKSLTSREIIIKFYARPTYGGIYMLIGLRFDSFVD